MLVKFFNTGKGSARHAFNYLLNDERVRNGTAKLIKGNPDVITFLTEQRMKDSSYRGGALYTSGVLSFSTDESKSLDDAMLDSIIRRFEYTMFPLLDMSRFNIAWILHNDKHRTELHFVIQNFDLVSKKSFTPFVASCDLSRVNKFKDKVNADFKLSDPNLVKSHYHIKGLKRLSEEQKLFYSELNKAYSQFVEARENPSMFKKAKGFLSKIMGQNAPQAYVPYSNEDKQTFLQKFITERFKGLKINRSSDKYASIDFNGSKMRIFYEKLEAKELDNAFNIKVGQNKEKGLLPIDYKPFFKELNDSYIVAYRKANEEKERLKREKGEAEKERLRIAEIEKQQLLDRKFRELLTQSKDIFVKEAVELSIWEYKQKCNELLKPTFMGTTKVHDFLFYLDKIYPDNLNLILNNTKSKLRDEYGQQRLYELELNGFFDISF